MAVYKFTMRLSVASHVSRLVGSDPAGKGFDTFVYESSPGAAMREAIKRLSDGERARLRGVTLLSVEPI